jgi:hypothetical protein
MVYRYGQKLQTSKRNLKKYIAGAAASLVLVAGAAVPALAANGYCGASANGCDHAMANNACSGAGAFGYLGKGNNPGDPSWDGGNGPAPGTSGYQTGLNNSSLCGNRQGNL